MLAAQSIAGDDGALEVVLGLGVMLTFTGVLLRALTGRVSRSRLGHGRDGPARRGRPAERSAGAGAASGDRPARGSAAGARRARRHLRARGAAAVRRVPGAVGAHAGRQSAPARRRGARGGRADRAAEQLLARRAQRVRGLAPDPVPGARRDRRVRALTERRAAGRSRTSPTGPTSPRRSARSCPATPARSSGRCASRLTISRHGPGTVAGDLQGRGGWLLGLEWLLPWMFSFEPDDGLRRGDVRRLDETVRALLAPLSDAAAAGRAPSGLARWARPRPSPPTVTRSRAASASGMTCRVSVESGARRAVLRHSQGRSRLQAGPSRATGHLRPRDPVMAGVEVPARRPASPVAEISLLATASSAG